MAVLVLTTQVGLEVFYQSDLARRQLLLHLLAPEHHAAPYTPLPHGAAPHDAAASVRSEASEGRAAEGRVSEGRVSAWSEPQTWLPAAAAEAEAGAGEAAGVHLSGEVPEVVMASGLVAEELADALRSSVLPPDLFSAMAEYEQLMRRGAQRSLGEAELAREIAGEAGEIGEIGGVGEAGGVAAKRKGGNAAAAEASASLRGKAAADALFGGKAGDGRGSKGAGAEAKGAEGRAAEGGPGGAGRRRGEGETG